MITVFINNAADTHEPDFGDYTYDSIIQNLAANFGAIALCTQEAAKRMDTGSILFTSSIYGLPFGGHPGMPLYSASKAALINFSQGMAEKRASNIRCNVVAPGSTRTPHWDEVSEEYKQKALGMSLLKAFVEPEEIAAALLFLAQTPHITAQTITIDAGWQKKIRDVPAKQRD